jgi:hypothetical protein
MTNDIMAVATSLMKAETPASWLSLWEGPENPQSFMRDTVQNALYLDSWKAKSQQGSLLAGTLKLSHLFNPMTFLNALRQFTSRKGKDLSALDWNIKLIS